MCIRFSEVQLLAPTTDLIFMCTGVLGFSIGSNNSTDLPNIIFLLADDLGYGDVGYNGGQAETPTLDAMASGTHSIQMTRFYSGGPVCSPTRGTLLTGRNHNRYCVWEANTAGWCSGQGDFSCPAKSPLPMTETTVAEILKSHGYQTAIFGKWHLGNLKQIQTRASSHPGQHGFDVWKVTERSTPTANPNCACFNSTLCVVGHYKKKKTPVPCTNYHSGSSTDQNLLVTHNEPIIGDDSDFLAKEFAAFLNDTADRSQPFFAYIAFHTVHKRYTAVQPYINQYKTKGYTSNQIDYYGAITAMDDAIGKIRDLLVHYNISDNTMIWFASDNGPELKSPGNTGILRGRKRDLLEGGIRVPGIIEWPAVIKTNRVSQFPVTTMDFLPTVCDIVHATIPQDRTIDGVSILPFIRGEVELRSSQIMWAFNIRGNFKRKYTAAITDDQYKVLVEYHNGRVIHAALYDLLNDPGENHNISAQHQDKCNQMTQDLEVWRQSVITSAQTEVGCISTH